MVACFRYASISVHSVYLPPSKLEFNYYNQEWIQREANEVQVLAYANYFYMFLHSIYVLRKLIFNRFMKGLVASLLKFKMLSERFQIKLLVQGQKTVE